MKTLFFDMDGTICESRQKIAPWMKKKLKNLNVPLVIVSGAEQKRMKKQLDGLKCELMAQNGNHSDYWFNALTEAEDKEIMEHLERVSYLTKLPLTQEYVHNRGCQISFSFTGHNAKLKDKKRFDPSKDYRNTILTLIPFKSKTLEVRVAGTTCFDYNRKNSLKGDNIKKYLKIKNLKPEECVYYGDNFDKGGNDESVLGIMRCVKVTGPNDLYRVI